MKRALSTFSDLGLEQSVVIGGYKSDQLELPEQTSLIMNYDYESNNILHSLAHAREQMKGSETALISYSDIIFQKSVVAELLADQDADISIVVDLEWKKRYKGRILHPLAQCEAARFDSRNHLLQTCKDVLTEEHDSTIWGEFIGMLKMTAKGQQQFWGVFDDLNSKLSSLSPFQGTAEWRKAYITDIMQEMVDRGIEINCSLIRGGWLEIDTTEDYETASEFDFGDSGAVAAHMSNGHSSEGGP